MHLQSKFASITLALLCGAGLFALTLLALTAAPAAAFTAAPLAAYAQPTDSFVPVRRLFVHFSAEAQAASGLRLSGPTVSSLAAPEIASLLQRQGVQSLEPFTGLPGVYTLLLSPDADPVGTAAALSGSHWVDWAEPDYLAQAAAAPNDPYYPQQWSLAQIQAANAWAATSGQSSTIIAVIDSGFDFTHPDLQSQVWTNPGEIPANGLDDDSNGYVDDIHGWDFVQKDNDPSDDNGHGTQVAGILAAATNNAAGIAGMCPNCRIMPVKVMGSDGAANYSSIAAGILYAAQKGASVINLSLGGYSASSLLQAAVQSAVDQYDVVVVAGAGNDNQNRPFYPAAYPEVLTAAGTNAFDQKSAFSNYADWVDLAAPAESMTTTFAGGGYGIVNGTSFASPLAAGVAGLVRSANPAWNAALVRSQLIQTSDPLDASNPAFAGLLGAGRLNAFAALTAQPKPVLTLAQQTINADPYARPLPGQTFNLGITLHNNWLDAGAITATLTSSDPHISIITATASLASLPAGASAALLPEFKLAAAANTPYNQAILFELQLNLDHGAYTATLPITVTTAAAEQNFCGTINANLVWTKDKTYIITCNVGIAPGKTLTIEPGTFVLFNGSYNLNVGGTLIAAGTPELPVHFLSKTGAAWGRIFFDNASADAQTSLSGAYLSGSTLQYAEIKGAAQGIGCLNATPYLRQVSLDQGGLTCTAGAAPLWLLDSTIDGDTTLYHTTVLADHAPDSAFLFNLQGVQIDGGLNLNGPTRILTSTIQQSLSSTSAALIQATSIGRNLTVFSSADLINSTVLGKVEFSAGSVQTSHIYGDVYLGSGSVYSSSLQFGGITIGTGSVVGSSVEDCPAWGIYSTQVVNYSRNRVAGCTNGIQAGGGAIQGNLIANTLDIGLQVGSGQVLSNTITGSQGRALIVTQGLTQFQGNNFDLNTGSYTLVMSGSVELNAQNNFWGTTDPGQIASQIFDFNDDYNYGLVNFEPLLAAPSSAAPAYIRSITTNPAGPIGIETFGIDIQFSKAMDPVTLPEISLIPAMNGQWSTFDTSSGLIGNAVPAVLARSNGDIWYSHVNMGILQGGVSVRHPDGATQTYTPDNSGLPFYRVLAIDTDQAGNLWFATFQYGLARLAPNGDWQTFFNPSSSNYLQSIAVDLAGNVWVGGHRGGFWVVHTDNSIETFTPPGLVTFTNIRALAIDAAQNIYLGTDGVGVRVNHPNGVWDTFDTSNSGLASNYINTIEVDPAQNIWFGTYAGVSILAPDGSWRSLNNTNSGITSYGVNGIAFDAPGRIWLAGDAGLDVLYPVGGWKHYKNITPGDTISAITVDPTGSHWLGSNNSGLKVLWDAPAIPVDNQFRPWSGLNQYFAQHEISTLVQRGDYRISVQNALGSDGVLIAPAQTFTFTVDYAGAIGDTTPPPAPLVRVCAGGASGSLSGAWVGHDPESGISLARYAIGTTPGGVDIVNWTESSGAGFTRQNLGLAKDQLVYLSVKVRNIGGLWSPAAASPGVLAGSNQCATHAFQYKLFIPLNKR